MNIAQKMTTLFAVPVLALSGGMKPNAANAARTIATEHTNQVELVSSKASQAVKAKFGNFEKKLIAVNQQVTKGDCDNLGGTWTQTAEQVKAKDTYGNCNY